MDNDLDIIFNNLINDYNQELKNNQDQFERTGIPSPPRLFMSINTDEFEYGKNKIKETGVNICVIRINEIYGYKVFLYYYNDKYYVIKLGHNDNNTIYDYKE